MQPTGVHWPYILAGNDDDFRKGLTIDCTDYLSSMITPNFQRQNNTWENHVFFNLWKLCFSNLLFLFLFGCCRFFCFFFCTIPRICSRCTVRVNGSRACSAGLWRLLAFFFLANEAKNHGENPDEHRLLGGGNSNIFYFHPYILGEDSHFD